jgi:UDP-N-acetylmuramoylalanine--D-glutamate ligase
MSWLADAHGVAVLGLGRSGRPATSLACRRLPEARVWAIDEGEVAAEVRAELEAAGAVVLSGPDVTGAGGAALPADVDLLVRSPGVTAASPVLAEARRRGLPVWSEVEFAARFLDNRVIGITGTNGKTTTTVLTGRILEDAGVPVAVAGNIGYALANLPEVVSPETVVVAELSSFQLEDIEAFRPDVAVLLNLTEDHLDRHGGYAGYVAAKLRIFENQAPGDVALLNADDPGTLVERVPGRGRRGWFSTGDGVPGQVAGVTGGRVWLTVGGDRSELCAVDELSLKGDHNLQNSLAAAAAASAVGAPPEAIATTLRTFEPVAHRLQVAGVVGGVTYVNDSKATNVDATLKALTAYSGPVYLILGGLSKGSAFDGLAVATEGLVRQVVLIGRAAPEFERAYAARAAASPDSAVPFVTLPDLAAAVAWCAERAVPGDVVLLSPACASYDQYRSYEERGEHFLELVSKLRTRG